MTTFHSEWDHKLLKVIDQMNDMISVIFCSCLCTEANDRSVTNVEERRGIFKNSDEICVDLNWVNNNSSGNCLDIFEGRVAEKWDPCMWKLDWGLYIVWDCRTGRNQEIFGVVVVKEWTGKMAVNVQRVGGLKFWL